MASTKHTPEQPPSEWAWQHADRVVTKLRRKRALRRYVALAFVVAATAAAAAPTAGATSSHMIRCGGLPWQPC